MAKESKKAMDRKHSGSSVTHISSMNMLFSGHDISHPPVIEDPASSMPSCQVYWGEKMSNFNADLPFKAEAR